MVNDRSSCSHSRSEGPLRILDRRNSHTSPERPLGDNPRCNTSPCRSSGILQAGFTERRQRHNPNRSPLFSHAGMHGSYGTLGSVVKHHGPPSQSSGLRQLRWFPTDVKLEGANISMLELQLQGHSLMLMGRLSGPVLASPAANRPGQVACEVQAFQLGFVVAAL